MSKKTAVVWASQDIDPKYINPELTTSEPYVMGSHATCSGAWASGPEDLSPDEYYWGYNRMMTVEGLFGAGDALGGTAHAFSSGSFTEGRLAAKAAVKYIRDHANDKIKISDKQIDNLRKVIYQPLENYQVGRNEIVAGSVSPSYLPPLHGLQRLEKIMDEYVGGIGVNYMTNEPLLNFGLEKLRILQEDLEYLGAEDLHQLQRAWELRHRIIASECVTQHTLFRKETRWPGYYYRGDHLKLDSVRPCLILRPSRMVSAMPAMHTTMSSPRNKWQRCGNWKRSSFLPVKLEQPHLRRDCSTPLIAKSIFSC